VILKNFQLAAHQENTTKFAAHLLQNKVALKKLMRWVCLLSGTNTIETRFCRCQTHPHFVVNSKKSLIFCF